MCSSRIWCDATTATPTATVTWYRCAAARTSRAGWNWPTPTRRSQAMHLSDIVTGLGTLRPALYGPLDAASLGWQLQNHRREGRSGLRIRQAAPQGVKQGLTCVLTKNKIIEALGSQNGRNPRIRASEARLPTPVNRSTSANPMPQRERGQPARPTQHRDTPVSYTR